MYLIKFGRGYVVLFGILEHNSQITRHLTQVTVSTFHKFPFDLRERHRVLDFAIVVRVKASRRQTPERLTQWHTIAACH